jgi:sorbitol-specific phosphotransferase system component IIA
MRRVDLVELGGDLPGEADLDIADEAEGDVVAFPVDPAGAGNAAPHEIEALGHIGRNFNAGKQARHGGSPVGKLVGSLNLG